MGLKGRYFSLLVFALFLCLRSDGWAEDKAQRLTLHTAIDHLENKEFLAAYNILIPMALQGDAEAQYQIGWMYDYGQGVPKNICIGTLWHDKAARIGHMRAQRALAFAYHGGDGLPRNAELAYRWLLSAIRNGLEHNRDILIEVMSYDLSPWLKQRIENTMDDWRAADQPPADVVVIPDRVGGKDLSNRRYYDFGFGNCIPDYTGTSVEKFGPKIYRP